MIDTVLVLTDNWPQFLRENAPWFHVNILDKFAVKNKMKYMFVTSKEQCMEMDKDTTAYILGSGSESNPAYEYVTSGIFTQGALI